LRRTAEKAPREGPRGRRLIPILSSAGVLPLVGKFILHERGALAAAVLTLGFLAGGIVVNPIASVDTLAAGTNAAEFGGHPKGVFAVSHGGPLLKILTG